MDPANADTVLRRFFAANPSGSHPESFLRYERVRQQLRVYLEEEGAALLGPIDQELMALERQFSPTAAYTTVVGARELLHALPHFLAPRHLLPDVHDRLAQISITSRLVQWLCSRELVGGEESRQDVVLTRVAVEQARRPPAPQRGGRDHALGTVRGSS
ncbi:hypothetical protein AC792_14275 [Arthrobacter sp. RIT-PI-e]|uniref:hypothetical protein n=1 Tax=Arthrobacter sp. RIT-PI-e TaxID=1681197 RepID=UPI000676207B|nr:hypothetical protein [Arthrobacter sp. RIT-PI-e]KNC17371.1 hypothetical protein AC792_14275 [Arthrobacter sp. RIT-PI-e]